MTDFSTIEQLVRSWELPLSQDAEQSAIAEICRLAEISGYSDSDYSLLLSAEANTWVESGTTSRLLRIAFDAALAGRTPILMGLDAKAYFRTYKQLRAGTKDVAGLSGSVARRLLSRSSLVAHLLAEEKLSCSQIARLLVATEASLDVSYGSIAVIARVLGMLPKLDHEETISGALTRDESLSMVLFPDSSLSESCETAATEIAVWLPGVNLAVMLARVSGAEIQDREPLWPYLQILHWCLLSLEYYDHPSSYLYEFAPRGKTARALFSRYPAATGNPVLNNAKAVETLNSTWARNRGGVEAHALVDLLKAVESLPYVPRRQVARVLRAWLLRVIELRTVKPHLLPPMSDIVAVGNVIDCVVANPTNTAGVIEQRVVDYLSTLIYSSPGWRARGLGDGVNASNLSRRKLGDVEFSSVENRTAIAVEAHGGHLSSVYVEHHRRSLARALEQRLAESWASIDEAEEWLVRVIFVAHSRAKTGLPKSDNLHGVLVEYEYMDYEEFVTLAAMRATDEEQLAAFHRYVVTKLNEITVRESVRERFRVILSEG